MSENTETKNADSEVKQPAQQAAQAQQKTEFRKNTRKIRQRRTRSQNDGDEEGDKFESKIINIRRVSRMYKGGRRMRLSVVVVVGDKSGLVGLGIGKGADVRSAQQKAVIRAKRNLIKVDLKGNTIPHYILHKYGASKIMLRPAAPGTGIVAGSSVRAVMEMAGVKDVLGKILGANNSINNAYATVQALESLRATRL